MVGKASGLPIASTNVVQDPYANPRQRIFTRLLIGLNGKVQAVCFVDQVGLATLMMLQRRE